MTDKLEGIKPGDRVRVTFEGVVEVAKGHLRVCVAQGTSMVAYDNEMAQDTFQIERIEPPLKVGDRVKIPFDSRPYIVRTLAEGFAWVYDERWPDSHGAIQRVVDLERIA